MFGDLLVFVGTSVVPQGFFEKVFDMRIKRPEFIICPSFQGSVKLGVKPQQDLLFLHLSNHLIPITSMYAAITTKTTMFIQNILGASALVSQPFPLTKTPCLTQQNPANNRVNPAIAKLTICAVSIQSPTIRLEEDFQSPVVTYVWWLVDFQVVEQSIDCLLVACTSFVEDPHPSL